ncbi:ACR3 family arsenite efflux transporter [Patulibacter defluvii]|uniref:ACR3 family arsenite efflux transporter n=1 Tax=Patulibacter defluvii TaxID=3095358 RepID=UPI002A75F604|nr:ACR3 family arsenite efflux transporter [Patulibacter sp. DM4]
MTAPPRSADDAAVIGRLSTLDRFLPLWIALAMAAGLGLGAAIPSINDGLDHLRIGTVSLPIALGLLLMMYPVLAKVRYGEIVRDRSPQTARMLGASLVLNWLIGPALMFALAWIFLADQPEFRTGLIIVGLARCIAMVLIWSDLSCADRESTALLVAINSVFQIVAYSLLGWFYLTALPDLLGLDSQGFSIGIWEVARTVLVFLGIPLVAGALTRVIGVRRKGEVWYEQTFLPQIGPFALYGLLFTIVMLFAIQGDAITSEPLDVARIALPLLVYFALMFAAGLLAGRLIGATYARTASLAFTAAGNNFELAIAVAIGVFGATSGQALAGVVGPLIEVPVLVGLVYVALWIRRRYYPDEDAAARAVPAPARPATDAA